ncbi:hypothetical protein DSECCO2_664670 [anaerobic digester metagenome]
MQRELVDVSGPEVVRPVADPVVVAICRDLRESGSVGLRPEVAADECAPDDVLPNREVIAPEVGKRTAFESGISQVVQVVVYDRGVTCGEEADAGDDVVLNMIRDHPVPLRGGQVQTPVLAVGVVFEKGIAVGGGEQQDAPLPVVGHLAGMDQVFCRGLEEDPVGGIVDLYSVDPSPVGVPERAPVVKTLDLKVGDHHVRERTVAIVRRHPVGVEEAVARDRVPVSVHHDV